MSDPPISPRPNARPWQRGGHFSDGLVEDARRLFSKRYGRVVTDAETRRMLADLTDFCEILLRRPRNRN